MNSKLAVGLGAPKMIHSNLYPELNFDHRLDRWTGWIQFTWHVQVKSIALKILAIVFALCSLIVLLCELTFYFNFENNYLHDLFNMYA